MKPSLKQIEYAVDLITAHSGMGRNDTVTSAIGRRYGIPIGIGLRETIQSLTADQCSEVISSLK